MSVAGPAGLGDPDGGRHLPDRWPGPPRRPALQVNGQAQATLSLTGLAAGEHLFQAGYAGAGVFREHVRDRHHHDQPGHGRQQPVSPPGHHRGAVWLPRDAHELVVHFDEPLDPAAAKMPHCGHRRRPPPASRKALYDPAPNSVMVHAARRIDMR